jgi:lysozyme family protein
MDVLPDPIAVAIFDVWVNGGSPIQWLQKSINDCMKAGTYALYMIPLSIDGALGPKTVAAAHDASEACILKDFITQREARFKRIATGSRAKFLEGWQNRDKDLKEYLGIA